MIKRIEDFIQSAIRAEKANSKYYEYNSCSEKYEIHEHGRWEGRIEAYKDILLFLQEIAPKKS